MNNESIFSRSSISPSTHYSEKPEGHSDNNQGVSNGNSFRDIFQSLDRQSNDRGDEGAYERAEPVAYKKDADSKDQSSANDATDRTGVEEQSMPVKMDEDSGKNNESLKQGDVVSEKSKQDNVASESSKSEAIVSENAKQGVTEKTVQGQGAVVADGKQVKGVKLSSTFGLKVSSKKGAKTDAVKVDAKQVAGDQKKVIDVGKNADGADHKVSKVVPGKSGKVVSVDEHAMNKGKVQTVANSQSADASSEKGVVDAGSLSKSERAVKSRKGIDLSGLNLDRKEAGSVVDPKLLKGKTEKKQVTSTEENKSQIAELSGKTEKKNAKAKSAKSARSFVPPTESAVSENLKNSSKTRAVAGLNELGTSDREIGIKGAIQSGEAIKSMFSKEKKNDEKGTDKVFLRDHVELSTANRAQVVTSRSDVGGQFNQSHSGGQDQGSAAKEHLRQWLVDSAESRSTGQSVQQTQFVDKGLSSQLSAHVLNQIVSHIEKMRESEKNRVRISLGGEKGGISVDIKIEDGSITTSFEGDESILEELKRDWSDLSDRASKRGITLNEPEFISYSSPAESHISFPDTGLEKEDESQSVIQHNDNKPVRPVLQTAAAGSSGPVHSYA